MSDVPETRYAKSGDVHIAYQVLGEGPLDLVLVPGFVSHLEYQWQEARSARFLRRLASFSRLIRSTSVGPVCRTGCRRFPPSSSAWTTCAP